MKKQKYWLVVASKEDAIWGASGGFKQINHGKEAPLKRIQKDIE